MAVAVFIDKDGTLVENVPYNVDPMRIRCCPGPPMAYECCTRRDIV
jgi:D-glycero-D-manno-heptose 1,7-bisphosphate phosphatase